MQRTRQSVTHFAQRKSVPLIGGVADIHHRAT
jgi:hypothetical protein